MTIWRLIIKTACDTLIGAATILAAGFSISFIINAPTVYSKVTEGNKGIIVFLFAIISSLIVGTLRLYLLHLSAKLEENNENIKIKTIMEKKYITKWMIILVVSIPFMVIAYLYALNGRYIYTKERIIFDKWEKCYIQPKIDGSLRYFKDAAEE